MKEEQIILKGLQQGSEQAYKDLFTAYFSDLVLYANHFIKNQAAAEDIVQDFFITLWFEKKFSNIENGLESYLYRSLHNTCLNHLRNEQRKQEKLLHMTIEKDSSPTLTTELEDKEREYNQLYQALHKLPEQCKQVFTLCCLQDMKKLPTIWASLSIPYAPKWEGHTKSYAIHWIASHFLTCYSYVS